MFLSVDLRSLAAKLPDPEPRPKINWGRIKEECAEYEKEKWKGKFFDGLRFLLY